MNNSDEPNPTMIRYLDGELTGTELAEFERLLESDLALQAEFENLQIAKLAVVNYGLKSQVAAVHRTMMDEFKQAAPKPIKSGLYPFVRATMRIAAVLFGFVLLFGGYQFATVSSSKLFTDNNLPYDVSVARGAAAPSIIEEAYVKHHFSSAANALGANPAPTVKDQFIGAQAYLAAKQPAMAIKHFKQLLNKGAGDFKDDAEYYLGLSYLANNQPAEAKPLFEKIYHNPDHIYHTRVTYWTLLRLKLLIIKNPGK